MKLSAKIYTGIILTFLFAPIVVMLIYSFNEAKSLSVYSGFSLRWYKELLRDRNTLNAVKNTLILAFAGGSVSMLVLDYAYDLPYQQIINSNNIGIAIMQGLSGSFGIVLAVPVTVLLAVLLYTHEPLPESPEN